MPDTPRGPAVDRPLRRQDETPDALFYRQPRFVTNIDEVAVAAVTQVYRETLPEGGAILDLMSSWVSHLPKEVEYKRVVGHGLNAQELAKNPRLDYFFVKDLNQDQELQLESCSFDAVLCTVSVQYLQWPEKVFNYLYFLTRFLNHFIKHQCLTKTTDKIVLEGPESGSANKFDVTVTCQM